MKMVDGGDNDTIWKKLSDVKQNTSNLINDEQKFNKTKTKWRQRKAKTVFRRGLI
jgi:hypothetical protein